eukprot:15445188-Alexandrium_andersonii.AAC.1
MAVPGVSMPLNAELIEAPSIQSAMRGSASWPHFATTLSRATSGQSSASAILRTGEPGRRVRGTFCG